MRNARSSFSAGLMQARSSLTSFFNTTFLPKASRVRGLTRLFVLMTGVWGLGLAIASFAVAYLLPDYGWTSFGAGFVGLAMMVASVFGVLAFWHTRTTRMLLFYSSMILISVFCLLVLAGASFFNRQQVGLFIEEQWEFAVDIGWPASYTGKLRDHYNGYMDFFDTPTGTAGTNATSTAGLFAVSNKREVRDDMQNYMILMAALCWAAAFMLLSAVRHVADVVGIKRAMVNVLETVNMMMLPLGLISVMAGQFIADSATLASSSITSFVLAITGVVMMALSFLGCFATAVDSRGALKVYALINFCLGIILVASGIGTIAVAETVEKELTAKWDTIRLVLPPTFKGKYDRQQFSAFVSANLFFGGYVLIVFGAVLGLQWRGAQLLRDSLKFEQVQRTQAESTSRRGKPKPSQATGRARRHMSFTQLGPLMQSPADLLRQQFRDKYKKGTERQRRLFKYAGCFCCLLLLGIIAIVVSALIFSTFCDSLSRDSDTSKFQLGSERNITVVTTYKTGDVQLWTPDTKSSTPFADVLALPEMKGVEISPNLANGSAIVQQFALSKDQAEGVIVCNETGNTCGPDETITSYIGVIPKEPDRIVGLDVSCQYSTTQLMWPVSSPSRVFTFRTSFASDMTIGLTPDNVYRRLTLAGLAGSTDFGAIQATNIDVEGEGVNVLTSGGDIIVKNVSITGNNAASGGTETFVKAESDLGQVSFESVILRDTTFDASAINSAVAISLINARSDSSGVSPLLLRNIKGSVNVDTVLAENVEVTTDEGAVFLDLLTLLSSSSRLARLSVGTGRGDVAVERLRTDGNVQIDTQSGNVLLQLLNTDPDDTLGAPYVGIFELRVLGSGTASIRMGGTSANPIGGLNFIRCSNERGESACSGRIVTGSIGCNLQGRDDCPYTGGIRITTHVRGDIEVILGCNAGADAVTFGLSSTCTEVPDDLVPTRF